MSLNNIEMGSIVTIEDWSGQYVVVGCDIREDMASMAYDRDCYLMPLEQFEKLEYYIPGQNLTHKVNVTGIFPRPHITVVEDVAPFKLTRELRYKIERKKPKVITIYE